jgi:hypothetical protein
VNAREAHRRQQVIANTLAGMSEILEQYLHQELDPVQEVELARLITLGTKWRDGVV